MSWLKPDASGFFEGYTHQRGSHLTSIACILSADRLAQDEEVGDDWSAKRKNSPLSHDPTLAGLRSVMSNLPTPASDGFITGEPVLVSEGFRLVQLGLVAIGVVSSILVSIVLLFCFRSLRVDIDSVGRGSLVFDRYACRVGRHAD